MNKNTITDIIYIRDIIDKSLELQNLNSTEVSSLIALDDKELWPEVFDTARRVKEKVYGKNIGNSSAPFRKLTVQKKGSCIPDHSYAIV